MANEMIYNPDLEPDLFDYNTSFMVVRTNPALTGNVKITTDSSGGVALNSINANSVLSDNRFKKYTVSKGSSYAIDLYNFFDAGSVNPNIVFDVSKKTDGDIKSSEDFSLQYDFFYTAGATTLIDKNYSEDFSYLAPLCIKKEIPDFFVIFKTPEPLSYPYSQNVNSGSIQSGKRYKVIQDPNSVNPFVISYGSDSLGNPNYYTDGDFFEGSSLIGSTYSVAGGSKSGIGKVVLFDENFYQSSVNNIPQYFKNKILPNSYVVSTFDLRKGTVIGDYIREISENPAFPPGPIDFNFGDNSYTYYHGVDYRRGVYTKSGEFMSDYVSSVDSSQMIEFERYVTDGFSRNGIISTSILNLEFAFNDPTSDNYTINRYFGMYVSRNDLASLRLNGDFYYRYKDLNGNNNSPKPSRSDVGYYYDNTTYRVTSTTGVRLFYENAIGWLPGSNDTNTNDSEKLYYLTDRNDNFYSLLRTEGYSVSSDSSVKYGPYDPVSGLFLSVGSSGSTAGNFVIPNKEVDLRDFTGVDDFIGSYSCSITGERGRSYMDLEFTKLYDLKNPLVFKITWPGGSLVENGIRFDLIRSGDYSGIFPWLPGDYYNFGSAKVFNASDGSTQDVANSVSGLLQEIGSVYWDSATSYSSSIIRIKIPGSNANSQFSVSVFSDYASFSSRFLGYFDEDYIYSAGDIVIDRSGNYLEYTGSSWINYVTFDPNTPGYGKIFGVDFSSANRDFNFLGGSDYVTGRFSFSSENSDIVKVGNWVQTTKGFSRIESITRFIDSPAYDSISGRVSTFKNFDTLLVANLESSDRSVPLTSRDKNISIYSNATLYSGVFTFFDVKEFDFDYWSSDYSNNPNPETYRYFSLLPSTPGVIKSGDLYYVKRGGIKYGSQIYQQGTLNSVFTGTSTFTSFEDLKISGVSAIVVPAKFTDLVYQGSSYFYSTDIKYEGNLDLFGGFYGMESIDLGDLSPDTSDKISLFNYGKLSSEYNYLNENYNTTTSNLSRIVPFINKWGLVEGSDCRGNQYRLNSSPVFTPTNLSPSIERSGADPSYFTHEWFLLETPPVDYPVSEINNQSSYLPSAPDYSRLRSSSPSDKDYFSQKFTVSPEDYIGSYSNNKGATREFFSILRYNQANGFYETVFRGIRYTIRRRSNIEGVDITDTRSFVPNYRGFEDYKFSVLLRVEEEDSSKIQSPVKYEIIENETQKFVLVLITVVISDYRTRPLTSSTDSILDYTLLYTLSDKKKNNTLTIGQKLFSIDDIKLSAVLDLSYSSSSFASPSISPGRLYLYPNPDFDTDLREEINLTFSEGGSNSASGDGSFSVPAISSTYPWPIGVSKDYVQVGALTSTYKFSMPFTGLTGGVTVPIGSSAFYLGNPVFQKSGGAEYFDFIIDRISIGGFKDRLNTSNPYIKYTTYKWDSDLGTPVISYDNLSCRIEAPSYFYKSEGLYSVESFSGPQSIGENQPTSYTILSSSNLKSDMLRFSGFYEPLFRKIIRFKSDKNDTISGDNRYDLSFRNTTFGPDKDGFGVIKNLNYTKVSLGIDILEKSNSLPEGPVYPLINQTPIDKKDFSLFYSSWDPGYYNLYNTASDQSPVAGTRSMMENKSFFGSKIMQTPDIVRVNSYISMEVSKNDGSTDINGTNSMATSYLRSIQNLTNSQSGTGIGQLPKSYIGVDIEKMDEGIYPNIEVFWQKEITGSTFTGVRGVIRLDRILRRYLLNSGVSEVFYDNIISEFGVGNPSSLDDDVLTYIDLNVNPIFESGGISLFVKSAGTTFSEDSFTVRGDILPFDRPKKGFVYQNNFSLSKRSDLVYEFSYPINPANYYSMTFSFDITKI